MSLRLVSIRVVACAATAATLLVSCGLDDRNISAGVDAAPSTGGSSSDGTGGRPRESDSGEPDQPDSGKVSGGGGRGSPDAGRADVPDATLSGTGGDQSTGGASGASNGTGGATQTGSGGTSGVNGAGGSSGTTGTPTFSSPGCDQCKAQAGATGCSDAVTAEKAECAAGKCDALLGCLVSTGCALQKKYTDPFTGAPGIDLRVCYCGDIDPTAVGFGPCLAAKDSSDPNYPQGLCRQPIETLAGSMVPGQIGLEILDPSNALGSVGQLLSCTNTNCVDACKADLSGAPAGTAGAGGGTSGNGGATGNGGTTGSGGASSSSGSHNAGGATAGGTTGAGGHVTGGGTTSAGGSAGAHTGGVGGNGGAAAECTACETAACPDPLTALAAQCTGGKCDAVQACVASTGCDRTQADPFTGLLGIDGRNCYCGIDVDPQNLGDCFQATATSDPTYPHGPCRTQIEALAGASVPASVGSLFFDPTTPLGAVMQLESCENTMCLMPCCSACGE